MAEPTPGPPPAWPALPAGHPTPARDARRRRLRRVRRAFVLLVAFLLVLGGGVFAVVAVLGVIDARGPVIERCEAELTGDVRASLAPDQADNAALVAAVATRRGLPARAATIAIATGLTESKLRNIDYGDRDSLGIFQQRPSQGWGTPEQIMDPVYATNAFYDVLVTIEGYDDLPITDAAQEVQRSAFPDAYADHEQTARAFASALTGHTPASLVCFLRPTAPEEVAGAPAAVAERLRRDFGEVAVATTDDGALVVDAASLAPGSDEGEAARLGWAVAQWAVATADVTGAHAVTTAGLTWDRAEPDAAWAPAAADDADAAAAAAMTGPGAVVIR